MFYLNLYIHFYTMFRDDQRHFESTAYITLQIKVIYVWCIYKMCEKFFDLHDIHTYIYTPYAFKSLKKIQNVLVIYALCSLFEGCRSFWSILWILPGLELSLNTVFCKHCLHRVYVNLKTGRKMADLFINKIHMFKLEQLFYPQTARFLLLLQINF